MSNEYLNHLSSPSSMMSDSLTKKLSVENRTPQQPAQQGLLPEIDFHLIISNGEDVLETKFLRKASYSSTNAEFSFVIPMVRLHETQKFYNLPCSITCGDFAIDGFSCGFWGYDFVNNSLALVTLRFFNSDENNY